MNTMCRYVVKAHPHRHRARRATSLFAALGFATWLVGLGAGAANAQVNPTPPSTSFVYLNLSRASPSSTNPSYIGTFWVQYRYTSNSLDWWFRIAPKWVQKAGGNLVTFDYTVTTRGKKLNNYQRHERQRISSIHR